MTERADAVVVGGGVVGCALAYELARRGVDVLLLERAELGSQSTGRCAGGVRQQFSVELNVRLQRLAVKILADLDHEIGATAAFRQIGYLFVLRTAAQVESWRRMLQMWHRLGLTEARWVEPADVLRLNPLVAADGVLGGTFCPSDGIASPADVTSAYAAAGRRHGARIEEGVAVTGIDVAAGAVEAVRCRGRVIQTPALFDCAGAWSAAIGAMAGVEVPVAPYRRHIFVTDSFAQVPRDMPMTVDFTTSFYFHPEGDGALLGMSDRSEGPTFDTDVDWAFLERVVEVATSFAPPLGGAGIRTGWAGLYETTPDHQAILGPVDAVRGFWCACGFSGHGFMQAPAAGRLLAQLFTEGRAEIDLAPFGHGRFARGALVAEQNVI